MGRSYQTAQPQFVEDFVYTPPYEMLMKLAETKQNAYNTALATAKLFDTLNIQHLNSEDENYNVKELQRYYGDAANNIAEAIRKDKGNVQAYMPQLESLQKELMKDYTSGNISKIQGSATALAQWEKDNEAIKKDSPGRYQAARNYYLENWMKSGGNSLSKQWSGEQVTKDLNYEDMRKSIAELKASKVKGSRQTPGGGLYMVETERGVEEMSLERLNGWLLSQAITPENLASLKQSQQYGLGTYTDANGNLDWDRGSLFAPLRGMAAAATYKNVDESLKYSADSAAIAQMNEAGQNARHAKSLAWEQTKTNIEEAGKNARSASEAKAAKDLAYQVKIAEAKARGDMSTARELQKLYGQDKGIHDQTTSLAGTKYKNFKELTQAAKNDPVAKKLVEQILPNSLKEAGVNFKNPSQAKAAKAIVDDVITGKLNIEDIDSKILSLQSSASNVTLTKAEKDKAMAAAKQEAWASQSFLGNSIKGFFAGNLQSTEKFFIDKYQGDKAKMQKDPEYQKLVVQEKAKREKDMNNKAMQIYKKKEAALIASKGKYESPLNTNFAQAVKTGLEKATTSFEDKRQVPTFYEVSPSDAIGSVAMIDMFNDPSYRKEFSAEIVNKDGKTSVFKDLDSFELPNFTHYKGMTRVGPKGEIPMFVFEENGKTYNITANSITPQMRHAVNTAIGTMTNPSTQQAYQLFKYPEASTIKASIEASTLKGKNTGQIPLEFTTNSGRKKNIVVEYTNTNGFNSGVQIKLYDPLKSAKTPIANKTFNSALEAGVFLNNEIN